MNNCIGQCYCQIHGCEHTPERCNEKILKGSDKKFGKIEENVGNAEKRRDKYCVRNAYSNGSIRLILIDNEITMTNETNNPNWPMLYDSKTDLIREGLNKIEIYS